MKVNPTGISLVTVSYRGDFQLAKDLCASVDRWVDESIEHVMVVPRRDAQLFAELVGGRRRLVQVEDVLPPHYRRLRAPHEIRLGTFYQRRLRELWISPTGPVRGWLVQQIVKLSAPAYIERGIIVFADSDIVLVRPVDESTFVIQGKPRLYRVPGATHDSLMHRAWHSAAGRLLNIEESDYYGADYIGNLVTWRRDTLVELQARLAQVGRRRWESVVARQRTFSEYVLYGIFADRVLEEGVRDTPTAHDLVHAGWHYALDSAEGLARYVEGLQPSQVGVAIQSTEKLDLEQRRELVAAIQRSAGLIV